MIDYIEKSNVLIESLPYIQKFAGKTVVIKYGGSIMSNPTLEDLLVKDIVLMKLIGINPVIIHGGGNEITSTLTKLGIKSSFIDGLRITDKQTMEVAEMVLQGKINKKIVNKIQIAGGEAVGISGIDNNTFIVNKKLINGKDIGYVGEIKKTNTKLISTLIDNNFIPVIAPIGTDLEGNTYNINADYAASATAIALNVEKLVFLTDVEGILKDINDSNSLLSVITVKDSENLIKSGVIHSGMIPKIENCIQAIKKGVNRVHIIDGRAPHSLLFEIFTDSGIGTMFK